MSGHCCAQASTPNTALDPRYRRVLWIALVINAAMFGIEIVSGMHAASTSLLADSVDFFGDAANYGLSLLVLTMGVVWRSRAALIKGLCMGAFGCFVLAQAAWSIAASTSPEPMTMGVIGTIALLANLGVAALLYAYRSGDANMRSVWLCTRNDAIGNVAVILAAAGVFGTGSNWPDWLVAILMSGLALTASFSVIRHARTEMVKQATSHHHAEHMH